MRCETLQKPNVIPTMSETEPLHDQLYRNVDLPDDDTEPDEHGNEPEECVVCELAPPEDGAVVTTNRALFGVNHKLWIDPVCDYHDDEDIETKVSKLLEYAGVQFVADAVAVGMFTRKEAKEHLAESDHDELDQYLAMQGLLPEDVTDE